MATIADIKTAVESVRAAYQARVCKAIIENQDLAPTEDRSGRKHAPCDNYIWINGQVYLGGQFLPEDEEYSGAGFTVKIKIAAALAPVLNEFLSGSIGKTWMEGDVAVGFYYAAVCAAEKTALDKILPAQEKQIVLADENTTAKTWVFNTKKIIKSYVYRFGHEWKDMFNDFAHMDAPGVDFEMVTNKAGKITFKSDFDGKAVCYQPAVYVAE